MEVPSAIMSRYLERRKSDLEDCLKSLKRKNFVELEKVGHQLKGNGKTFGHPELSFIGNRLESAAVLKDAMMIEKALKEFTFWVNDQI